MTKKNEKVEDVVVCENENGCNKNFWGAEGGGRVQRERERNDDDHRRRIQDIGHREREKRGNRETRGRREIYLQHEPFCCCCG